MRLYVIFHSYIAENIAGIKMSSLNEMEKREYQQLIAAAKNRSSEDRELAYKVAGSIGSVGFIAGLEGVVTTGAALAAAGDFMDNDYAPSKIHERGKLSEREHYNILKKSKDNRENEDIELGGRVGEKLGSVVGQDKDVSTQVAKSAGSMAGKKVVSLMYKHEETPVRALIQAESFSDRVKKMFEEFIEEQGRKACATGRLSADYCAINFPASAHTPPVLRDEKYRDR